MPALCTELPFLLPLAASQLVPWTFMNLNGWKTSTSKVKCLVDLVPVCTGGTSGSSLRESFYEPFLFLRKTWKSGNHVFFPTRFWSRFLSAKQAFFPLQSCSTLKIMDDHLSSHWKLKNRKLALPVQHIYLKLASKSKPRIWRAASPQKLNKILETRQQNPLHGGKQLVDSTAPIYAQRGWTSTESEIIERWVVFGHELQHPSFGHKLKHPLTQPWIHSGTSATFGLCARRLAFPQRTPHKNPNRSPSMSANRMPWVQTGWHVDMTHIRIFLSLSFWNNDCYGPLRRTRCVHQERSAAESECSVKRQCFQQMQFAAKPKVVQ